MALLYQKYLDRSPCNVNMRLGAIYSGNEIVKRSNRCASEELICVLLGKTPLLHVCTVHSTIDLMPYLWSSTIVFFTHCVTLNDNVDSALIILFPLCPIFKIQVFCSSLPYACWTHTKLSTKLIGIIKIYVSNIKLSMFFAFSRSMFWIAPHTR